MDTKSHIIQVSPDIMGGTPVFPGTRVPIQTLFDYVSAGDSIDKFLEDFPSVSKKQILSLLEYIKDNISKEVA